MAMGISIMILVLITGALPLKAVKNCSHQVIFDLNHSGRAITSHLSEATLARLIMRLENAPQSCTTLLV